MSSSSVLDRRRRTSVRVRRAAMLLPLGVLSATWTIAVAGAGVGPVPAAGGPSAASPRVAMPERVIEAPASVSAGSSPSEQARPFRIVPAAQSTSQLISSSALAAYQRASTVIGAADETCRLQWPLLAAIGQIESHHGTVNGNHLRNDGVAVPGIIGIPLDGSGATASISDTDGGQIDGDKVWDRAVGPMQFIPSTWAVVGVDADDDGQRNPQDIDDAALAAAVYLCSGNEDLSTPAGQRAAVLRYNHSQKYVDTVLANARSYAAGGAMPVAAGLLVSARADGRAAGAGNVGARNASAGAKQPVLKTATPKPKSKPVPAKPAGPRGGSTPGGQPEAPGPKPPPASPLKPVETLLSTTEAILACTLSGLNQLLEPKVFSNCVAGRTS